MAGAVLALVIVVSGAQCVLLTCPGQDCRCAPPWPQGAPSPPCPECCLALAPSHPGQALGCPAGPHCWGQGWPSPLKSGTSRGQCGHGGFLEQVLEQEQQDQQEQQVQQEQQEQQALQIQGLVAKGFLN